MTKKEESSERIMNPLTPRAFIIGLILAVIGYSIAMVGLGLAPQGAQDALTDNSIMMIIILLIISLINPLLKARGFSTGELVTIYVMLMTGTMGSMNWGLFGNFLNGFTSGSAIGQQMYALTPDIWFPKDPAVYEPMLTGGAAVPWSAWMVPLFYWCIWRLAAIGIGLCFGLILAHSIIDVERLPFPYTQVITPLTNEPKKPLKERVSMRLLIAGIIIGFIVQGTYGFFQQVIPGFPAFWPKGIWGTVGYDLGPLVGPDIARNQHLVLTLQNLPSLIPFFFLMPTKVTGSALLIHFIFGNIFPYVEVSLGMVTNWGTYGVYDIIGWALTHMGTFMEPTGIQLFVIIGLGFPIGIIVTYIFFSRREILASLRAAIQGKKAGQFNDRILWITFVLSMVMYIVLPSVVGVPLIPSLMNVFFTFVMLTLAIKLRGEIIMPVPLYYQTISDFTVLSAGPVGSPETYKSLIMFGQVQGAGFNYNPGPTYAHLEGIRLLELSGEKWKWQGLVIAVVVALVIGVFFDYGSYIWGAYTYGTVARWQPYQWGEYASRIDSDISVAFTPGVYALGTAPARVWPELIIGIIVAVAITALSSMFLWWPIHPLGLVIGGYLGWGFWFQALLAFILRVVVLRVGGGKLYNKLVHLMLGLLIGYAISCLLYAVALAVT